MNTRHKHLQRHRNKSVLASDDRLLLGSQLPDFHVQKHLESLQEEIKPIKQQGKGAEILTSKS